MLLPRLWPQQRHSARLTRAFNTGPATSHAASAGEDGGPLSMGRGVGGCHDSENVAGTLCSVEAKETASGLRLEPHSASSSSCTVLVSACFAAAEREEPISPRRRRSSVRGNLPLAYRSDCAAPTCCCCAPPDCDATVDLEVRSGGLVPLEREGWCSDGEKCSDEGEYATLELKGRNRNVIGVGIR